MTADFIEKLLLLLATALLTGLVAPYVLKLVDQRRAGAQKALEAEITRQAKLIEAQATLLDELARLLWRYQLNAIEVSYYHGRTNASLYATALAKYEGTAGDLLGQIRAEISRSLHLTSSAMYTRLKALYYEVLLLLDQRLRDLIEGAAAEADWMKFNHYAVDEVADQVDTTLNYLATELRLKAIAAPETTR
jgi:hypothetical protein